MRSYKVKLSLQDIYLGVICIFPLSTMLIDGGIWNKAMFALLLATHMGMLLMRPVRRRSVIAFLILFCQYIFVISVTHFPMDNSNLLFYFPFFILYSYYMIDNMDITMQWFVKNRKYVYSLIAVWMLLVGISIFIPNCYYQKEGGEFYFGSFCESIFRLGPSAVFIQVLTIVTQILYRNRKAIWMMIVPMYCYFMGSSRTYLVIGLCLLAVSWYISVGKKRFWKSVIPLGVVFLLLIWFSPMGEKIRYTLDESNYGDFWFRITSSRSVIWSECLREWGQTSIVNKLIGNDIGFTAAVTGHWAHNDFIEILCSFGIVGLVSYLAAVRTLYRKVFRNIHVPFVVGVCVFMIWFFNAFFNMHYVYFCAMLSYPILVAVMGIWSTSSNELNSDVKKKNDEK